MNRERQTYVVSPEGNKPWHGCPKLGTLGLLPFPLDVISGHIFPNKGRRYEVKEVTHADGNQDAKPVGIGSFKPDPHPPSEVYVVEV
jgi:hypothetical protein